MSNSYKKTRIIVEVLSAGDWDWDNLADVSMAIESGPCSGLIVDTDVTYLDAGEMAKALKEQGSDPEFLLSEEDLEGLNSDQGGTTHAND